MVLKMALWGDVDEFSIHVIPCIWTQWTEDSKILAQGLLTGPTHHITIMKALIAPPSGNSGASNIIPEGTPSTYLLDRLNMLGKD